MHPDLNELPAWTDHYFLRSKATVQRFGDKQRLIVRALSRDNGAFSRMLDSAPPVRGRAAKFGSSPIRPIPFRTMAAASWRRSWRRRNSLHRFP